MAANGAKQPTTGAAAGAGAAAAATAPPRSRALIKKKEPIPEDTPVSDDEREYVKEFRAKMNGKADTLSDMTVLRFIRGFCCSDNPEAKALEMLGKMTDWRAKEKVDDIAKMRISFKTEFNEVWNSGIHGLDKEGHPIFVDRPGLCDPNNLKAKGFDVSKIMLNHIQHMESLIATEEAVSKARGKNRYKHIAIIDMQGLGMKHLSKEFYGPMKTIIDIDQFYYPDTLFKLFIVNAPFIFRAMWAVVSPMVDPVTRNKINFGTDNLEKFIDKESLPKFLGGTCKCEGGKCLRTPFISGKDERLPEIDIAKGNKNEKGETVNPDGTVVPPTPAAAADAKSAPAPNGTANGTAKNGAENGTANGEAAAAAAAAPSPAPAGQNGAPPQPASGATDKAAAPEGEPAAAPAAAAAPPGGPA